MSGTIDNVSMPSFDNIGQEPMSNQTEMDSPTDEINGMLGNKENNNPNENDKENFSQEADEDNYENDFDAGVEANEEEDPEKYLQQLTGKLCNKLKKFNDEKPKPDVSMCKYIAGMVLAQCIKGLDENEKDEILSKLTKGDEEDNYESNDAANNKEENSDDGREFGDDIGEREKQENDGEMNEDKKIVERIVQNVKNDIENKKPKGTSNKRKSYKMSPYIAPDFD